jgi:hypothetical protein
MAVVQISRIQVRRGRSNGGTGIPQLASGELGWAVDTQELFVGNGSVSEGAPFVGNTRILTEATNIFDLVEQYQYQRNDSSYITGVDAPVQRTLQQRLDDRVSVRSFGAKGDGSTDDTLAIQRAIDAIYIDYTAEDSVDFDPKRRVELMFEPGIYKTSSPLYLYPFITLKGAGKDKTIIRATGSHSVAIAVSDPYKTDPSDDATLIKYETDVYQYSNENQPRYLSITGITFEGTALNSPVFIANAMRNSVFTDVKFKSVFERAVDAIDDTTDLSIGLWMLAKTAGSAGVEAITCENNLFDNCEFQGFAYGVDSTDDIQNNTFRSCLFRELGHGVYLGYEVTEGAIGSGKQFGPRWTHIENSKFIDIDRQGLYIGKGIGNISKTNSYINVGNDGGSSASVVKYPIIEFEFDTNVSDGDYFQRAYELSPSATVDFRDTGYVSDIAGSVIADQKFFPAKNIVGAQESILLKLPGSQDAAYRIKYYYVSSDSSVMRSGTITLLADLSNNRVHISDEFDLVGNIEDGENLTFTAEYVKSAVNVPGNDKDSVILNYSANQTGTLKYWYEIQS